MFNVLGIVGGLVTRNLMLVGAVGAVMMVMALYTSTVNAHRAAAASKVELRMVAEVARSNATAADIKDDVATVLETERQRLRTENLDLRREIDVRRGQIRTLRDEQAQVAPEEVGKPCLLTCWVPEIIRETP